MLIQVKGGGRNGVNYHAPVTTAGNRLEALHADGKPFDAEWPEFTGFIYP